MATVHLVCGFLSAGKTTFATELAARVRGVRFSVDELYLKLFADGPTYDLEQAALDRLFAALADLWPEVVRAGVDVVLDFGFWSRARRDEARTGARAVGANSKLYFVHCADEVAVKRCLARNGAPGAFLFSEQGYWELKPRFEPPTEDESPEFVATHGNPGGPALSTPG